MTIVRKGLTGPVCSRCRQSVGQPHLLMCEEASMQEASRLRPPDFAKLSGEERWVIDKRLGILDWEGF